MTNMDNSTGSHHRKRVNKKTSLSTLYLSHFLHTLLLIIVVLFGGCFDPVSSSHEEVTESNVLVVQIEGESGASRTALPTAPVPAAYNISVTRSAVLLGGLSGVSAGSGPFLVQLTQDPALGDIVTVESFDSVPVKNAEGSYTLTAGDLGGTPVTVTLRPLPAGTGTGSVDLKVSFDPGTGTNEITSAELKLYQSLADYQGGLPVYDTKQYRKNSGYGPGTDFTVVTPSEIIIPISYAGIPSGNYALVIEFFRGLVPIRVSRLLQAINVRGALTTETWVESNSDTLTWNAFGSSNANLAGSDGIKLGGTTIAGYDPATVTYNIYEATTSIPASKTLTVTGSEAGQRFTVSLNGGAGAFLTSGTPYTLTQLEGMGAGSPGLKNSLAIKVTAPDGLTEKTYTVNISGKEIIDFYFTIGGKHYGVGTGTESGSGSISGTSITVTVPYGTDLTALGAPTVTHSGASIAPAAGTAWGSAPSPHTYTVTAEDGTTEDYSVTVSPAPGITISGITVEGLTALTFTSTPALPANVSPNTSITITISGGTVSGWYIEVSGGASATQTHNTNTFNAPLNPGFYNVNVIATVDGVDYSGSFGLIVN
jgi:hypothetical protein